MNQIQGKLNQAFLKFHDNHPKCFTKWHKAMDVYLPSHTVTSLMEYYIVFNKIFKSIIKILETKIKNTVLNFKVINIKITLHCDFYNRIFYSF